MAVVTCFQVDVPNSSNKNRKETFTLGNKFSGGSNREFS